MLDFIIKAKGNAFRILQLTDTQIIDSAQQRYATRLCEEERIKWQIENVNAMLFDDVDRLVRETNPDLILITGDVVYGEFDDKGTSLQLLIEKFESYKIPWAPVWGNHDNECEKGADWQCQQFVEAPYCLFAKGKVTGTSNYTVGIADADGQLQRVLYMLDSHGCDFASEKSLLAGVRRYFGFTPDQFEWMAQTASYVRERYAEGVPAFACFHVMPVDLIEVLEKKGMYNPIWRTDRTTFQPVILSGKNGDFGCAYEALQVVPPKVTPTFRLAGVDGVFMGHHHKVNLSVEYEGIRWTHGAKTGRYDYHRADMLGGTVIDLSLKEKTFKVKHHTVG